LYSAIKSVDTEALVTPTARFDPNIRATGTGRDLFLIWSTPEFKKKINQKRWQLRSAGRPIVHLYVKLQRWQQLFKPL